MHRIENRNKKSKYEANRPTAPSSAAAADTPSSSDICTQGRDITVCFPHSTEADVKYGYLSNCRPQKCRIVNLFQICRKGNRGEAAAFVKRILSKVTWSKTKGAKSYVVYRKVKGSKNWTKIATIKSAKTLSYLDKTAKKGKKYVYQVKAKSGKTYSAAKTSKTVKRS